MRDTGSDPHSWTLTGVQPVAAVITPGWTKVEPSKAFPTFTTSRPSMAPGRKPAGLGQCSAEEVQRWHDDLHRFPPYTKTYTA